MRRLQWILVAAIGVTMLTTSHTALTEPAGSESRQDEAAIQQVIANWDNGWKVFDAELATRDYAADADWTNAFGLSRKGRADVHKFLADFYQHPGTRSRKKR